MSVNALNSFTFDLFRVLCKGKTKNEFFSPFSILTALNMTLLGAKNKTENEMFQGLRYSLGFSSSDEVHSFFKNLLDECENFDSCTLSVANRVLIHKSDNFQINPDYANQLLDLYKAEVNEANFDTECDKILKTCNEWVNEKTNGKIPSILDSLNSTARAVLLNAIYFKGMWEHPFEEKNTKDEIFYNFGDEEKPKRVSMMQRGKTKCRLLRTEIEGEKLQMLELPYKGSIVMCILMTKSLNGLEKIEQHLNNDIFEKMNCVTRPVSKLWLPKFKMESKYELVDSLIEMGVREAFSNNADFSGITQDAGLTISRIVHKAAIEVNEEGTVAAAATSIIMVKRCLKSFDKPIEFIVDHPFICLIKNTDSGVILFAGRVNEL